MKELTKKILESGIIDRATARLMERWGQLSPEDLTLMHSSNLARDTINEFVEELELLLQPEAIEKQEVQLEPLIEEVYDPTKGH